MLLATTMHHPSTNRPNNISNDVMSGLSGYSE
jgi:hypothetical protein